MKQAYQSTEHGFRIMFPNDMTVSVTWYRKTTNDGGQTSAEVIVWDKDNVRYEYEEGLWREGEGLDEHTLPSMAEWKGINCYVKPRKLVEILDAAESYVDTNERKNLT